MRQGDKGTVFVSSLFVAGKIYAVTDSGGKREVKTYVATPKDITRYDDIESKLDSPGKPVMGGCCSPRPPP